MPYKTLDEWLDYQLGLYVEEIDLGLERVKEVALRLDILNPDLKIITVGGTNGKGSTVALVESILCNAGFTTGTFTSPHLLRYTERIKLNNAEISISEVIAHFELIEKARGDIKVTYFEFAALAAMLAFINHKIQVAVLEVGLGGRLDATNIWDADVAIVTNIGLDHQKWLGHTKEQIAVEKAGIFRKDKLAIIGDSDPPVTLLQQAASSGAYTKLSGRNFDIKRHKESWDLSFNNKTYKNLKLPNITGEVQLINAACAILAVSSLGENISTEQINAGLSNVKIQARLQTFKAADRNWLLDVAHNPESVKVLAYYLAQNPGKGTTIALFAMLEDKDIDEVIKIMQSHIDIWCVLNIASGRAMSTSKISESLSAIVSGKVTVYNDANIAVASIVEFSKAKDRIVVFGSFYTVGAVMNALRGLNV